MPLIETGPEAPGGRPKKSSGGVGQVLTMIVAWAGGAAAAAAAAFWILQIVKPDTPEEDVKAERTAARDTNSDDYETRYRAAQPSTSKPARTRDPKKGNDKGKTGNKDKVKDKPPVKFDRRNFQRPEMAGLVYRYFENESFAMKDFATVSATRSGVLTEIGDLKPAQKAKGLQLAGYWKTKTEQPCDFSLESTNGARLWIDDQLVLDTTTQFQSGPVKGSRTIQPGMHHVRVDFLLQDQAGAFTLGVGATGDPNRMNLDQLLQPFESTKPNSIQKLEYNIAKYPNPAFVIGALVENNRQAVAANFFETESAEASEENETATTVMPDDGRLLAGIAFNGGGNGLAGVKPIFLNESGLSLGETIGSEAGEWRTVIAKPGFAVSGIRFGRYAKDGRLEFMKIGDKSLLPTGAYSQGLRKGSSTRQEQIGTPKQPVIGLRAQMSDELTFVSIQPIRVVAGKSQMLMILAEGFPKPAGLKETPLPSVVKKELKKLMKQSAEQLSEKTGNAQRMELKALASSTEQTARNKADAASEFVSLLEARRLYIVAGDFKSAFAITDQLSREFDYDYWKDLLALFSDSAVRAKSNSALKRAVCVELGPAIANAEAKLEFEAASKLASGGKMLATSLEDQSEFQKYQRQMKKFEQLASVTKQARIAAKTLVNDPDNGKANRTMGVFFLAVPEDWGEAMKHFSRSASPDYEFIAEHDRNFNGSDAKVAMKLADCWKRVGKKVDALNSLANSRARNVLQKAKGKASDKTLEDLRSELKNL